MYTTKKMLTLSLLLAAFSLSACSNNAENTANLTPQTSAVSSPSPVTSLPAESTTAPELSPSPENTPVAEPATSAGESTALPEYLPDDFPLPDNVEITLSHSEENEGKKAALLIFRTTESMDSVTKLYKDYLSSKLGSESAQTIDDNNLIIQGTTKDNMQSWSIIGGPLSAEQGVVELNVTWTEM